MRDVRNLHHAAVPVQGGAVGRAGLYNTHFVSKLTIPNISSDKKSG